MAVKKQFTPLEKETLLEAFKKTKVILPVPEMPPHGTKASEGEWKPVTLTPVLNEAVPIGLGVDGSGDCLFCGGLTWWMMACGSKTEYVCKGCQAELEGSEI